MRARGDLRAMILAAGLGTRLRPLSAELPKPLMPVGDRPLLAHLARALARAGLPSFAINIHYLADKFIGKINDLNITCKVIPEPEIRGTAGGVAGARELFGRGSVLVWNGDVIVEPDVPSLFAAADEIGMAFAVAPRPLGEGTLGLDAAGKVVRLRGEQFGVEVGGADYVGVAGLGEAVLDALPATGCLVGDVALPRLRRGESIATLPISGGWVDIGSLREYLRANLSWLSEHAGAGASWVAPSAVVASGVALSDSVVGAGATVSGSGELARSVVWPGAHAVAPLSGAVVTTSGRVVPVS